jgi:serine/threonine protein kinase
VTGGVRNFLAWIAANGGVRVTLYSGMRGWFGPFRLEKQVGRGGLGAVYRAVDTRTGGTVALKMLPPGTDPAATRRLRR